MHPMNFSVIFFLVNKIIEHISQHSSLYSIQKTPEKPVKITPNEVKKYVSVCVICKFACIKNVRYYWHPLIGITLVQETVAVNKFDTIRRYIHLNNNKLVTRGQPGHDKLFKLRPA